MLSPSGWLDDEDNDDEDDDDDGGEGEGEGKGAGEEVPSWVTTVRDAGLFPRPGAPER